MKYSLDKEHFHFYRKNGYVEFEGMINNDKLVPIQRAFIKQRLDTEEKLYIENHDIWRRFPEIKKTIFHRTLSSVIADLADVTPLRIGYDQLIPKGFYFKTPKTLREMSSIQGVVGGYLLCLENSEFEVNTLFDDPEEEGEEEKGYRPVAPFSTIAGNIVFIHPDAPIDFSRMTADHLLVCFSGEKAVYRHNEADLHTHFFKTKGYVFGDKIQERDLPTVLREFNL